MSSGEAMLPLPGELLCVRVLLPATFDLSDLCPFPYRLGKAAASAIDSPFMVITPTHLSMSTRHACCMITFTVFVVLGDCSKS